MQMNNVKTTRVCGRCNDFSSVRSANERQERETIDLFLNTQHSVE